jgi:hypothetical protein
MGRPIDCGPSHDEPLSIFFSDTVVLRRTLWFPRIDPEDNGLSNLLNLEKRTTINQICLRRRSDHEFCLQKPARRSHQSPKWIADVDSTGSGPTRSPSAYFGGLVPSNAHSPRVLHSVSANHHCFCAARFADRRLSPRRTESVKPPTRTLWSDSRLEFLCQASESSGKGSHFESAHARVMLRHFV